VIVKTRSALTAVAGLAIALSSCADPTTSEPKAVGIVIVGSDSPLYKGETRTLSATLTYDGPAPSRAPRIVWTSSAPAALWVGPAGNLVGLGAVANAIITATVQDVVDSVALSVSDSVKIGVLSDSICTLCSIYPNPAVLSVGYSSPLRIADRSSGYPGMSTISGSWTSNHPEIVSVDNAGVATGLKAGNATIALSYRGVNLSMIMTVMPAGELKFTNVSGRPFPENIINGVSVVGSDDRNCGVAGGSVYCWGHLAPGFSPAGGCFKQYLHGSLIRTYCSPVPVPLQVNATFATVSMSYGPEGCALTTSGDVYCFGIGKRFVTGFSERDPYRLDSPERFRAIYTESEDPCAIATNGIAYCWGAVYGSVPTPISTYAWNTMAAGSGCGIAADSTAFCWKPSKDGATMHAVLLPYHWSHIDVSSSEVNACALAGTGELACWSLDNDRVPTLPTVVANTPKLISLGSMRTDIDPLPVTEARTCGLTGGGEIFCVVPNGRFPSFTYSLQQIDLGVKLKSFSGNCGIALDGKAYCWQGNLKAVLIPGQQP
jgi:hypothetical protein